MQGRDRSPSGPQAWTENARQGPISERSASMDRECKAVTDLRAVREHGQRMQGRDRSPSGPRAWTENARQGPISERSASMDCDYWESAWLRSLIIREIIHPSYDGPLGDRSLPFFTPHATDRSEIGPYLFHPSCDGPLGDRSLPFSPLIRRTARRSVPTFFTPHTTDRSEVGPYLFYPSYDGSLGGRSLPCSTHPG